MDNKCGSICKKNKNMIKTLKSIIFKGTSELRDFIFDFHSLKGLKSNLCAFLTKDANYEMVSYNPASNIKCTSDNDDLLRQNIRKRTTKDDLDLIISPRVRLQESRSRLPIYYNNTKQTTHQANNDDLLLIYEQPWHSTKVDLFQSTLQNDKFKDADDVTLQQTLNLSQINSRQGDSLLSSSIEDSSSTASSNNDTSSNEQQQEENVIYACCLAYNALHDGDISVKVADRIHILYDAPDSEYVLVKLIRTQQCGYIPRICILNVNKFLSDLN